MELNLKVNSDNPTDGVLADFCSLSIKFVGIDEDLATFQEDEMVQQALQRGVELTKYADELEKDLKRAEADSVDMYIDNSKQVEDLYSQMQQCDSVLARMEEMLHGFQADLGEISAEIRNLQDDSLSMSIKLKNRREVQQTLHSFVRNAVISGGQRSRTFRSAVPSGLARALSELYVYPIAFGVGAHVLSTPSARPVPRCLCAFLEQLGGLANRHLVIARVAWTWSWAGHLIRMGAAIQGGRRQ